MNLKHLFFLTLALFLFSSCGDDCEEETLEGIIVGEWTISAVGQTSNVTFRSDGTLSDPDDILIIGEINGTVLSDKTYEVLSDQSLELTVTDPNGSDSLNATYEVSSFECDEVVLSIIGQSAALKRK